MQTLDLDEIEDLASPKWAPVLIIVPPSVIANWMNEFKTWGHFSAEAYAGNSREKVLDRVKNGLNEVLVCGNALAKRDTDKLKEIKWKLIIIDEVHVYKVRQSIPTRDYTEYFILVLTHWNPSSPSFV